MKIEESKTRIWTGSHQGVQFEIKNWATKPNSIDPVSKQCWTYYLYIHLSRIPEENKPNSFWLKGKKDDSGRVNYDYYKHWIINNIELHSGITYYEKVYGFDGSQKTIKIGCDYMHIWDEDCYYDIESLKSDVMTSIHEFRRLVPNYKYWCCGNGNLYNLEDGKIKGEQFYSKEYWGDKDWYKELLTSE